MATVDITNLTNATTVSDGTGVFDILMKTVNLHIEEQYKLDRVTGGDYATVYLGALQYALAEALKYALAEQQVQAEINQKEKFNDSAVAKNYAEIQLIDERRITQSYESSIKEFTATTLIVNQNALIENQILESIKKQALLDAQTIGFTTDAKNKLLKQMLDSAAVNATTTGVAFAEDINSPNSINGVANDILDDLSSTVNIIP